MGGGLPEVAWHKWWGWMLETDAVVGGEGEARGGTGGMGGVGVGAEGRPGGVQRGGVERLGGARRGARVGAEGRHRRVEGRGRRDRAVRGGVARAGHEERGKGRVRRKKGKMSILTFF